VGGPCGWEVTTCGCGTCWDNNSPATRATAQALAGMVMWAATGRRYGPCRVTVQPCNPPATSPLYQTFPRVGGYAAAGAVDYTTEPVLIGGTWFNQCSSGCTCRARCEVVLDGPVADIVEITVGGLLVDPAAYQIQNRCLLVRVDGGCWPTCIRVDQVVPDFEVIYRRGRPIPTGVQKAFEVLACEFAAACTGGACRLPPRLASLTRQGVDIQVEAVHQRAGAGTSGTAPFRTGIALVDDIIALDNPTGRAAPALVMSPDQPEQQHRYVSWRFGS
jgi:hypothetical protein